MERARLRITQRDHFRPFSFQFVPYGGTHVYISMPNTELEERCGEYIPLRRSRLGKGRKLHARIHVL